MIKIRIATIDDFEILALLGRLTWSESHGPYIEDKNEVLQYLDTKFSVSQTKQNLNNPNHLYYIIYMNDIPAGYAKTVLNSSNINITTQNSCQLERIFILNEFISLKIGQQLLSYTEVQARKLQLNTMWLTVYIKNLRAIRFYERNEYKNVGKINFNVAGKDYENIVFSKKIYNPH